MTRPPAEPYEDREFLALLIQDAHTLRCPLMECGETFDVPDIPISDELGAVFGLSGDTLARIHGDQQLKRTNSDIRQHLAGHPFEDWMRELMQAREALKAQLLMWAEVQR